MKTLLLTLLLAACQPVDFGNYNIFTGWEDARTE